MTSNENPDDRAALPLDPQPISPSVLSTARLLTTLFAATVGAVVGLVFVLTVGWLVSRVTSLSTFQGAVLFTGVFGVFRIAAALDRLRTGFDALEYEVHQVHEAVAELSPWEDDLDDDDESEEEERGRPSKVILTKSVNPNDRCPCGSGRKVKNCHGARHQ